VDEKSLTGFFFVQSGFPIRKRGTVFYYWRLHEQAIIAKDSCSFENECRDVRGDLENLRSSPSTRKQQFATFRNVDLPIPRIPFMLLAAPFDLDAIEVIALNSFLSGRIACLSISARRDVLLQLVEQFHALTR